MIEFGVDFMGYSFVGVYGSYGNGGFIALPIWGVSCDAGSPEDIYYNKNKLYNAFSKHKNIFSKEATEDVANTLALALCHAYQNEDQY